MPQRIAHLKQTLAELDIELSQFDDNDELDAEARQKLLATHAEISEMLASDPQPDEIEPTSAIEQLAAAERDFEASNPTLTGLIQRVIHALAQMGI